MQAIHAKSDGRIGPPALLCWPKIEPDALHCFARTSGAADLAAIHPAVSRHDFFFQGFPVAVVTEGLRIARLCVAGKRTQCCASSEGSDHYPESEPVESSPTHPCLSY